MNLDTKDIWKTCLQSIQKSLSPQEFKSWFEVITPLSYVNSEFLVQVPNSRFYDVFDVKYAPYVIDALQTYASPNATLCYQYAKDSDEFEFPFNASTTGEQRTIDQERGLSGQNTSNTPGEARANAHVNPMTSPMTRTQLPRIESNLNPRNTFETYMQGESNKLAVTIGKAIAQDPGKTFNPSFIFGESGVGKTHLAQAIGTEALHLHPEKRVLYVSAHDFKIQYTEAAVRHNAQNDFINFYQNIDLLIIDDIQDFANQTKTQKTFFHIFKHLVNLGKQLIFCCDRHPRDLEGVQENIITRFLKGFTHQLQKPDLEIRHKIVRFIAQREELVLSEDIIDFIAKNVDSESRSINGVIVGLSARASLSQSEITLDLARMAVEETTHHRLHTPVKRRISTDMVRDVVCKEFNVRPEDLLSKIRKRTIAEPRQIAMYLSRKYTEDPLAVIGKTIGNRDHSTVVYAIKTVQTQLEIDEKYRNKIELLRHQIEKN